MLLGSAFGGMGALVVGTAAGWWAVAPCAATLALLRHAWRTQVTRAARSAVDVVGVDMAGEWWLATRAGAPRSVRFASVCAQRWAIVAVASDDAEGRYPLVVFADAMPEEQFRRLSARLRMLVLTKTDEAVAP